MPVPDVGIEDEDEESTTDAVEAAELAEVVVEPPRIEVAFMPDKGRDKERGLLEVSVLDALDVPLTGGEVIVALSDAVLDDELGNSVMEGSEIGGIESERMLDADEDTDDASLVEDASLAVVEDISLVADEAVSLVVVEAVPLSVDVEAASLVAEDTSEVDVRFADTIEVALEDVSVTDAVDALSVEESADEEERPRIDDKSEGKKPWDVVVVEATLDVEAMLDAVSDADDESLVETLADAESVDDEETESVLAAEEESVETLLEAGQFRLKGALVRRLAKGKPVNIPAPGCGFCAATQLNAETTAGAPSRVLFSS